MKKYTLISLLFLYAFSITELHELLKLPLLVSHFDEHRHENKDLNLGQFLNMHYNQSPKDSKHEKDHHLPYKSHHNCYNCLFVAYLPQQALSFPENMEFAESKDELIHVESGLLSNFQSDFWQPPKVV